MCLWSWSLAATHLPSGQVLGVVVEVVDVGAEGLEVRDDKLLAEGLREQHDVALDTPGVGGGIGEPLEPHNHCFLVWLQHHGAIKQLRW